MCRESYVVDDGDSCSNVAEKFGLTLCQLGEFNTALDCCKLFVGTELCVSLNASCEYRHEVVANDTCTSISDAYKLLPNELAALNNNALNCSRLPLGRLLCVRPEDTPPIPNFQCTQSIVIPQNATCLALSRKYQVTVDELLFVNPQLRCYSLKTGSSLCVKTSISQTCSAFAPVSVEDTCESLMAKNGISELEFYRLNPFLRCDALRRTFEVCVGQGYFHADRCVETKHVPGTNVNCSTLATLMSLSETALKALNPFLNCTVGDFQPNALVCVRALGDLPTSVARDKVIDALKVASPLLSQSYSEYKQTPDGNHSQALFTVLAKEITKPSVYNALKDAYQSDSDIRKVVDGETANMNRTAACEDVKKRRMSSMIVNCVCNKADLMVYCRLLTVNEFANITRNGTGTGMRRKRSGPTSLLSCSPTFPKPGSATIAEGCLGGGCTIPILPVLEFQFNLETCLPPISWLSGTQMKTCQKPENAKACNLMDTFDLTKEEDVLSIAQRITTTGSIAVCLIGTDALEIVTEVLGVEPCWEIVAVSYAFFTGVLKIESTVDVILAKFVLSFNVKVHDLVYPPLCDFGRFECEDYCIWQENNERAGAWTGTFKITVPALTDEATLFEEAFRPPSKCNPAWAHVGIRNERTCYKPTEAQVEVDCRGEGKLKQFTTQDLTRDGRTFHFKTDDQQKIECFVTIPGMPTPQKGDFNWVHFCLYGPDDYCGGRTGKGNYFFVVRNDGIYYGRNKGEENQALFSFPPCKDWNDVQQIVLSMEPTGKSQDPGLLCGKRIVGYYTGWGEGTISEFQLRRLTHVIFAFVEMSADGSLSFVQARQTETGYQRTKDAARFKYMRELARKVEAGVTIMVAMGGSDNSQYFSQICADATKRNQFVTNIANFLVNMKIDGVEIAWEYPVGGGASYPYGKPQDRENFVAFLAQLRLRLSTLKDQLKRRVPYVLSIAGGVGDWIARRSYDLDGVLKAVDFVNVMSYDYYHAFESLRGMTAPPAPLYSGVPQGFSGKFNVDNTMQYYSCKTRRPDLLNMGIPLYGRYWDNVGDAIDPNDPMWRIAQPFDGKISSRYVGFRDVRAAGFNISVEKVNYIDPPAGCTNCLRFHAKSMSHYWWDPKGRRFLGIETPMTAYIKAQYARNNNFGGIMLWALDLDDDISTLLQSTKIDFCQNLNKTVTYDCTSVDVGTRWWTIDNGGLERNRMCGKYAPLIDGYYAVCDPGDPSFSCCGPFGKCGTGDDFCKCSVCVDYGAQPSRVFEEPVKPTRPVQWFFMDAPIGQRGRCGPLAPKLNGSYAICNPDHSAHCCSKDGYCGPGPEFCDCEGCVDFAKNPYFKWPE